MKGLEVRFGKSDPKGGQKGELKWVKMGSNLVVVIITHHLTPSGGHMGAQSQKIANLIKDPFITCDKAPSHQIW